MAIAVHSEKLRVLVDENAEVEQIATGFTFTEGPIWMADGSLHFSDMPADKRRRWHPDEGVTVLRDPSNKCNGMTRDNDGNLIVCEHVTSSVVRERPDGTRETLATHWGDKELNSPNDVIVARDGSILFTDPTYGRMPGFGLEREQDLDFQGVYRLPADGGDLQLLVDDFAQPNGLCFTPDESQLYINDTVHAHIRIFDVGPDHQLSNGRVFAEDIGDGDLELLIDDFAQPNGLCFSPDESLLYINDTTRAHIRVFDVGPNHALSNGRVFAENIGDGDLAKGGLVDGMKLDEHGNVYVTGPDGVWVFGTDGEHLGTIEVPESVGNINWGDDDWRSLYIPASTSVYRVRLKVAGNKLGYMN
jgi:gluconolactonase